MTKCFWSSKKTDSFKGSVSFPGGKVDEGEKVEDAVKRELREETGLDIEPTAILAIQILQEILEDIE